MADIAKPQTSGDGFTPRPFLFLFSLTVILSLLPAFLKGGVIDLLDGVLITVFFVFTLIAVVSAALPWHWRRLISIIVGAFGAICAFYLAGLLSYALEPPVFHYKLTGADWARIPEGYFGVVPEKIVAELNVPKEYLERFNGPASQPQSNISISVLYPSMKSAVRAGFSYARIGIIISANREADNRKGVQLLIHENGETRDAQADVDSLCAHVDDQHPGKAGIVSYSACNEAEQTFFIDCFPPSDEQRSCSEIAHIGDQLGVQLFYWNPLLKEHSAMLQAVKILVASFRPNASN